VVSSGTSQATLEPQIDLLVSFVNTRDVETGTDAIADLGDLRRWAEEKTGESLKLDEKDAARVRALRESLRALLRRNNGGEVDDAALLPLREAAERSRYRPALDAKGRLSLLPTGSDLTGFEARLLLAIERIQSHGAWARLKTCPDEECEWAFYDSTRNRSRTWCSMEVCGNREKTRRYRQRKGGG
jgi:predicted RNA-binding Zn ribbon-like protein